MRRQRAGVPALHTALKPPPAINASYLDGDSEERVRRKAMNTCKIAAVEPHANAKAARACDRELRIEHSAHALALSSESLSLKS